MIDVKKEAGAYCGLKIEYALQADNYKLGKEVSETLIKMFQQYSTLMFCCTLPSKLPQFQQGRVRFSYIITKHMNYVVVQVSNTNLTKSEEEIVAGLRSLEEAGGSILGMRVLWNINPLWEQFTVDRERCIFFRQPRDEVAYSMYVRVKR